MSLDVTSVLLFCLNLISVGIWWRLRFIDTVIAEVKSMHAQTRKKLDDHCEDFDLHSLPQRRASDRRA